MSVAAPAWPREVPAHSYVGAAVAGAASQQQLGAIPPFALIFFVAITAANTLVMLTRARTSEFALLRRIGATRHQLTSMVAIEPGFVIMMVLALGTIAVLPALTRVAYGLLGGLSLGMDWPGYARLAAAVVVIAGVAMIGSARVGVRKRLELDRKLPSRRSRPLEDLGHGCPEDDLSSRIPEHNSVLVPQSV